MVDVKAFDSILAQKVHQRNVKEIYAFSDLVHRFSVCQQEKKEAQTKATELERETNVLREENEALKFALQRSREEVAAGLEAKEHKEKAAALQEELTNSYKSSADVYQQLVSTRDQLQAAQEEHKATQEVLAETEKLLRENEERVKELTGTVDLERASCAEATKELETRLSEKEAAEARLAQLETEHSALIDRWMAQKMQEAEKLNDANAIYEDVVRRASDVESDTAHRIAASVAASSTDAPLPALGRLGADVACPSDMVVPSKAHVSFVANQGGVQSVALDSTASRILTGGVDRMVQVWEPNRGGHVSTLRGALQTVTDCCFSHDGSQVLAGSSDNAIRIWDLSSGRVKETLTGHADKVSAVCYSPADHTRGVSCGNDRCIKVWDLNKGYCVKSLVCHSSCNAVCVTLDGSTICSAHFDGSLRFWDMRKADLTNEMPGLHSLQVTSVSLGPSGSELLTNSRDNSMKLVDLRTFDTWRTLSAPEYRVGLNWSRSCMSPDARYACGGSADGAICIWRVDNGMLERTLKGVHQVPISSCAWSPTGSPLVTGDKGGTVTFWR